MHPSTDLLFDLRRRANVIILVKNMRRSAVRNHQGLRVLIEALAAKLLTCRDRVKDHRMAGVHSPLWQYPAVTIVCFGILVVFLLALTTKEVAEALIAAGTLGVVFWAIYDQQIKEYQDRPILRLMPFEQKPPYFREATQYVGSQPSGKGYYINLHLRNDGRTIAKSCQPLLNAQWRKREGEFQKEGNWLPLGLRWALDEQAIEANRKATEEKNLVPNRPYFFDLGCVSNNNAKVFHLLTIVEPSAQKHLIDLEPGDYCFEVLVTAEKCKPEACYFYVKWKGEYPSSELEVENHIEIMQSRRHPDNHTSDPFPYRSADRK